MARGKRPVTFRTRKLSLSAPMVLPWRRGGRVGRRRTTITERGSEPRALTPVRLFVSGNGRRRRVRRNVKRYAAVMTAPRRGSGGERGNRGSGQGRGSAGAPRSGGPRGGSAGRTGGAGRPAAGGSPERTERAAGGRESGPRRDGHKHASPRSDQTPWRGRADSAEGSTGGG